MLQRTAASHRGCKRWVAELGPLGGIARMKRVHTMSRRAKRVLYPALVVAIVTFLSFLAHLLLPATSAFPGGRVVDGRYLVEEHGRVIELTARQYWFSYIHGVVLVAVFAIVAVLVVVFYWRGDLKDEYHVA